MTQAFFLVLISLVNAIQSANSSHQQSLFEKRYLSTEARGQLPGALQKLLSDNSKHTRVLFVGKEDNVYTAHSVSLVDTEDERKVYRWRRTYWYSTGMTCVGSGIALASGITLYLYSKNNMLIKRGGSAGLLLGLVAASIRHDRRKKLAPYCRGRDYQFNSIAMKLGNTIQQRPCLYIEPVIMTEGDLNKLEGLSPSCIDTDNLRDENCNCCDIPLKPPTDKPCFYFKLHDGITMQRVLRKLCHPIIPR